MYKTVVCFELEVQLGHGLKKLLLSLLSGELEHVLWVTGIQFRLADRFDLLGNTQTRIVLIALCTQDL